jgi:hypothetical protein
MGNPGSFEKFVRIVAEAVVESGANGEAVLYKLQQNGLTWSSAKGLTGLTGGLPAGQPKLEMETVIAERLRSSSSRMATLVGAREQQQQQEQEEKKPVPLTTRQRKKMVAAAQRRAVIEAREQQQSDEDADRQLEQQQERQLREEHERGLFLQQLFDNDEEEYEEDDARFSWDYVLSKNSSTSTARFTARWWRTAWRWTSWRRCGTR